MREQVVIVNNQKCTTFFEDGQFLYNCPSSWLKDFDFLWWTGAVFWATMFVIVAAILLQLLWDFIGCIAFTIKVSKRVSKRPTVKEFINFTFDRIVDGANSVRFYTSVGTIYKPWPWLSKEERKALEDSVWIPG